MAIEWTITGQAGKTVDETAHTLAALHAQNAIVTFNSLASDTMTWSIWLESPAQADVLVPDLGQTITLLRNGTRYFTGLVTGRDPSFSAGEFSYQITVENAWWWLRQIFLSSERPDQSGAETERTAYVFATGSPRSHLLALIDRAIELGAPVSEGTVASCFNVPRLSLRNIPLSEAISEVMRWVADGIVYFDYSGAGHPALCMQRRTPSGVVTLTPSEGMVPTIRLKPRIDLKVEEVKVFFSKRVTSGGKRIVNYDAYTAGASTNGIRQPVMVSGPEKVYDILPQDFTDSVEVRSAALDTAAMIELYDERIRATGASGFSVGTFSEDTFGGGQFTLPAINTQITDRDGNAIPGTFNKYLTLGEPKDWWTKDGIEHIQARVAATIWSRVQSPSPIPGGYSADPPGWFEVLGGQHYSYIIEVPGGTAAVDIFSTTASVSVPLVTKLWATPTTLIRAEDYAFINPPADLAANLLETQDWLPYEGQVSYVADEIPAGHHVGKTLNIADFVTETAGMRALITGHEVRLAKDENVLRIGAPDRLAYRDLVNRFRQTGVDNIEWLVDSVSGDPGENPPPDPGLEIPEHATLTEAGGLEYTEDEQISLDETAP